MLLEYSLALHVVLISLMGYSFYKVGRAEGMDDTLNYLHEEGLIVLEEEN